VIIFLLLEEEKKETALMGNSGWLVKNRYYIIQQKYIGGIIRWMKN